ncbi:MAG: hypothetical protein IBJ19_12430 [Gemmatimonadaceae bacterium]|nr:hypothetical protein [Gemmatimonadaceae bacterium]
MGSNPRSGLGLLADRVAALREPGPYEHKQTLLADALAAVRPLLANPERDEDAVRLVIEYVRWIPWALLVAERQHDILNKDKWYNRYLPLSRRLRRLIGDPEASAQEWYEMILTRQTQLLGHTNPAELSVAIQPFAVLEDTFPDVARKRVVIRTTGAIQSLSEFAPIRISHRISILAPSECYIVSLNPDTRVEDSGIYEQTSSASLTATAKHSTEKNVGAKVDVAFVTGKAGMNVSTTKAREEHLSTAAEQSERRATTVHEPSVIATGIGGLAQWDLYRTSAQLLLGSREFSASVLVPLEAEAVEISVVHSGLLEAWGPVQATVSRRLPIHSPAGG